MRLLLTGATGLVGREVAALAAEDESIELIISGRKRPSDLPVATRFFAGDLSDASRAASIVRSVRPTHIIHAAWETRQPTYWEDAKNLDWVVATTRMAQAFAEVGGARFLQLGSCAEYRWGDNRCVEDVTPSCPATRYGKAKVAAFEAIKAAGHQAFTAVEARLFTVFGPGENPARFVPVICRGHLAGTTPRLSSGKQIRDFLYSRDAARAILMLAKASEQSGVVNIASGDAVSLAHVAETLAHLAGAPEVGLGKIPDRDGDCPILVGDSARIRSIGWTADYTLEAALQETLRWWQYHAHP